MGTPMVDCPSISDLDSAGKGQSANHDVLSHIEACVKCKSEFNRLRANNALADRLRHFSVENTVLTGVSPDTTIAPQIEGYECLTELSRGSQGIVYRARQTATKRTVALKVLASGLFATTRQRHRFEREIEIVGGLIHPNIVILYGSEQTRTGHLCFVMQYIDGTTLTQWILENAPPGIDSAPGSERRLDSRKSRSPRNRIKEILSLFSSICAGVEYAHQRGVIHRDLKPGNIMIDAQGEPHILDFGLAKARGREGFDAAITATQPGVFMGTIAYAAPEQVRGDTDRVDTRSDVYALGVILYEMLTAAHPYPLGGSMVEMAHHISDTVPCSPSHYSRAIRSDLDTIVMRALAKDPDRRYSTAGALRADVGHFLADEPIEAKRDSLTYVIAKRLQRHRIIITVSLFVLLLTILFGVERSRKKDAVRVAYKADLMTSVSELRDFLRDDSHRTRDFRREIDNQLRSIESRFGVYPLADAEALERLGDALLDGGEQDLAENYLLSALQQYRMTLGHQDPRTLPAMNSLAVLYQRSRRPEQAEAVFIESLELSQNALGRDHEQSLRILNNLANLYYAEERFDEARRHFLDGFEIAEQALPEGNSLRLRYMNNLGAVNKQLKRYPEA